MFLTKLFFFDIINPSFLRKKVFSMKNFFSFKGFMKKTLAMLVTLPIALTVFSGAAIADKPTTYLAPKYQDIPFKAETAFVSVAPAMDTATQNPEMIQVTNECELLEVASPKGFKVGVFAGAGDYAKDVVPNLTKSAEMLDSAKLRIIARMVKLQLITESGNANYAEFYKKFVTSPIALFIGLNAGTGPACAPMALYLPLKDGSTYFFNTVTFVEDIPKMFLVADAIANDTFDLVVAHENAHGIMFDMYGSQMKKVEKKSNLGHDGPVISDRGLAYIEGWAEAFEALYGPTNPLLKLKESEREKYRICEFLFTRQDPVRRDRYIWQTTKKRTGLLKNGLQILSTEGAIAGLFYDILTSKAIKDPFIKSITVMYKFRPVDFLGYLDGFVKTYPEDKNVLYRIFLEGTNYATVSNKARGLYFDYYQAKLKYVKKEMDQKAFYEIKNKWTAFKEDLFKNTMENNNINANVGPDLFMNVAVIPAIPQAKNLHINISTIQPGILTQLGLTGLTNEDIDKMIQAREAMGVLSYKTATEALKSMLGEEKANKIITDNQITDL